MDNNKGLPVKAAIMMAVGGMVGSSIFTLSGVTYSMAGPSALLTWFLAGAITLLYALNIAELATTFPQSGGVYVYSRKVLGKTETSRSFFGWITAWSRLNVSIFGATFSAICVSTYLSSFFPQVANSKILQVIIPIAWITLTWFLNSRSSDAFGKIQSKITISLLFVLAIYIVLGLTKGNSENMKPFISGSMGGSGIMAGIPIAMLGYGSIVAVASFGGEIENPKKNIPKIIVTAIVGTVIVYCMILLATFRMVSVDKLVAANASYYPLAFALGSVMTGKYAWIVSIVPLAALLALTTNMSIMIMDASRTLMATAQTGFLPKKLGELDPIRKTPVVAVSTVAIICALISLRPDLINIIINAGSICSSIAVAIVSITVITLRKKQKTGEIKEIGEFKIPAGNLFPIVTLIVTIITLGLLYFGNDGAIAYIVAGIWYLIGVLIFVIKNSLTKK